MGIAGVGSAAALLVAVTALAASATQARQVIVGTGGADVIYGTAGKDTVEAGAGADEVHAKAGADIVKAGKGRDSVSGGPNKDSLFGDPGVDLMMGGGGRDILIGGRGNDRLKGGLGGDQFGSVAPNFGYVGDDVLIGGRGIDVFLEAGTGDDVLRGGPSGQHPDAFFPREFLQPGGGADRVFGGSGPDDITLSVDHRADIIHCGPGHDVVTYTGGRDRLDTLYGCESVVVR